METIGNPTGDSKFLPHLEEGVPPIMACIGTPKDYGQELRDLEGMPTEELGLIDYYEHPNRLDKQDFRNAGLFTYVISTIDTRNKYSRGYLRCTGVVVCGIDKETGEPISFMTHQDPWKFLVSRHEKFDSDFTETLRRFREQCEERTIDAVIAGGNDAIDRHGVGKQSYLDSIELLSRKITEELGFEPEVIVGPKEGDHDEDELLYDNEHRRLYILRDDQKNNTRNRSYSPRNIESQEDLWK